MNITKVKAFAKINLGLQVLGKRPNGFHEINTVFVRTSFYDELSFNLSDSLSVRCSVDLGIAQESNLVYKAADLLRNHVNNSSLGADIFISKNIPSGAGLGGGSSDAASTLLTLRELWNVKISDEELSNIALSLGSDVPYFLQSGTATGLGQGEKLEYFDYALPYTTVLIFPGIHVSTAKAYQSLNRGNKDYPLIDFRDILLKSIENNKILKNGIINDFEAAVFNSHPELAAIKHQLYADGAILSLMSGSGSTIFGLFEDRSSATAATKSLNEYNSFIG